jgi:protein transport protein SEC24
MAAPGPAPQPMAPQPRPASGPQTSMNMSGFMPSMDMPTQQFSPHMPPGSVQPPPPPAMGQQYSSYGDYGPQKVTPPVMQGQPAPMAQPQPRRLDPDQMPSPIQVMDDDRKNKSGTFLTGQRGAVPPLVTTDYLVQDQGACSPRFLRSTLYNVPCTNDILKQTHLPFALSLSPFAEIPEGENPLPIVDLGQMGPVRCNRCKAYMSPYMNFTDGGRKFQCSFCTCHTEVPPEYFNHLDHTGKRVDYYDRPELCLGAYEFVATSDYCKDGKLPIAPAYIFMIDVSYQSVKSGLVSLLCAHLKSLLANLPRDLEDVESEIHVGFVTYSNVLHFYNIKGSLTQPQMMVVSDVQDVFVPLVEGFLVKVSEAESMIDMLLTQIPQLFADSRQTEVVLGPVIQAGLDALQSSDRAGKLFIFHSSLPTAEAPGKLKGRDDRNLLGTDKEKTLLSPQCNFYTKLGQQCVAAGCSVDLFLFPNQYVDVATVSEVCRITGGNVYQYTYFQADLSGDLLVDDLRYAISKPAAFDAVIRVRTSTGIRAVDFYGNFYMSNTTDIEVACLNNDSCLSVEIKHDDKLSEADGSYVQAAVLYTSVSGRRRLRILNIAFNTCTQIADMFRSCELDTYINFIAKHAIRECLNSNSRQVRDNLIQQCAQILACYRKNCASPSSVGQLILPECMKLLPLYINCVIKAGILQTSDIPTDTRSYEMLTVNSMDVVASNVYFYPQLIPIHNVDVNSEEMPSPIRCSYERLQENGIYLLDNGLILFMWIGLAANVDWIHNVLGVASIAQVDIDKTRLQDLDNPLSVRIRSIVKSLRAKRRRHMKLVIIRQRDKLEPVFLHYLMEDRTGSTSSYVDFLCHIHKEIRNLLS